MGHEIEKHDNVVLHRQTAWHGLGTVVEDAPTPREALTIAGLDWGISQRSLVAQTGFDYETGQATYTPVETHVANYRDDIEGPDGLLGVVTKGYQPVSNGDMADFCEALSGEGGVTCETAGSIRNGKRVWFLLKGEKFSVAMGDDMYPYILVSNGHDGGSSFRVTPTTVRAVCSNTLHAVIPQTDTGQLLTAAIAIPHTTNIMKRIEDAKKALKNYQKAIEETKQLANYLAAKNVTQEDVQAFFIESYTADFGPIAKDPQNKKEQRHRDKAVTAYNSFTRRFDDERSIAGESYWNAANAYTGLIQHDMKARGKDDADRINRRVDSNLFGLGSQRTAAAMQLAYTMAN